MKKTSKKITAILMIIVMIVVNAPISVFAADTTRPSVAISGPSNSTRYVGESVSYTVTFSDNEPGLKVNMTSAHVILNGFVGNIAVTGSGNTRTVNITNIDGSVGGDKAISLKGGAAVDAAGNQSYGTPNTIEFSILPAKDTTRPSVSLSAPSNLTRYAGETVSYTVTFTDNVGVTSIPMNSSYVNLVGFTGTISVTGSGNTRTVTISNIQGTVGADKTINIKAGAALDAEKNATLATPNAIDFSIIEKTNTDTTRPSISLSAPSHKTRFVGDAVSYMVTFTDNVAIASIPMNTSNVVLVNFTGAVSVTGSGNTRTVTITNIQGSVGADKKIYITEGAALDAAGNKTLATPRSEDFSIIEKVNVDGIKPVANISAPNTNTKYVGDTVSYTVTFTDNESVTSVPMNASYVVLNGFEGIVSVTGSGMNTRTVIITNIVGSVGPGKTIYIKAGAALDASGNTTLATANSPEFTILEAKDTTRPSISLSAPSNSTRHVGETVSYTVTFTDNKGITSVSMNSSYVSLIGFTGTVSVTGSGMYSRTVTITNIQGSVGSDKTIYIKAGAAQDSQGNATLATPNAIDFSIIAGSGQNADTIRPVAKVSAPNHNTRYVGETVSYTVTFTDNEAVTAVPMNASYVVLNGFEGIVSVTGSGMNTRTVTVSNIVGPVGPGKTIFIKTGAALDASGNTTLATANSPEFTILEARDSTRPSISLSAPSHFTRYVGETVSYTVTFTDNKGIASVPMNSSHVVLNGFAGNVSVTGSGMYSRTVTITNIQGSVGPDKTIYIKAGAALDAEGNATLATPNAIEFRILAAKDSTRPSISLSAPSHFTRYVGETVSYTVTFTDNEGITSVPMNASYVVLNGFTGIVSVTGSGMYSRTVTITNIQGEVGPDKTIYIKEGAALDAEGNATRVTPNSIEFAIIAKSVIITPIDPIITPIKPSVPSDDIFLPQEGGQLPKTSTPIYMILGIGMLLIVSGFVGLNIKKSKGNA